MARLEPRYVAVIVIRLIWVSLLRSASNLWVIFIFKVVQYESNSDFYKPNIFNSRTTMSTKKRTLIFVNSFDTGGTFRLFQSATKPEISYPANPWFQQFTHPTTRVAVNWDNNAFGFIWFKNSKNSFGIAIEESQFLLSNIETSNVVTLTKDNGAYTFTDQRKGEPVGTFTVEQDSHVVSEEVQVGLGLAGGPVSVVGSQPNTSVQFLPDYQLWIDFMISETTEAVYSAITTAPEKVSYPAGVDSMTVIFKGLDPHGNPSWVIKPTSQVNTDFIAAVQKDASVVWGMHYG